MLCLCQDFRVCGEVPFSAAPAYACGVERAERIEAWSRNLGSRTPMRLSGIENAFWQALLDEVFLNRYVPLPARV